MKVLVVEDQSENVIAALEFFENEGIEVEVVGNVEAAQRKLEEEDFGAAIIDVEIPRVEGGKPEKVGVEIGEIAKGLDLPHVYLTGGYHHHGPQAKVFLDEFCLEKNQGDLVPDKSNPEAWAKAWQRLQSMGNLNEIFAARNRYKKHTGKMYHRH